MGHRVVFTSEKGRENEVRLPSVEVIAAIDDARIDERRGLVWHAGSYPGIVPRVNACAGVARRGCEARQCPAS